MSEAVFWKEIQAGMRGRWHAQRHEDRLSMGIADVSYAINAPVARQFGRARADGWIELKYLRRRPVGDAPWDFKLDHLTPDQRNWLTLRTEAGRGLVFVMCRFGPDLAAIWHWPKLEAALGVDSFQETLLAANASWWHRPIQWGELVAVLTHNRTFKPEFV